MDIQYNYAADLPRDILACVLHLCDDRNVLMAEATCTTLHGAADQIWKHRCGPITAPSTISNKKWYWQCAKPYALLRGGLPEPVVTWFDAHPYTLGEMFYLQLDSPWPDNYYIGDNEFGPLWRISVDLSSWRKANLKVEVMAITIESQKLIAACSFFYEGGKKGAERASCLCQHASWIAWPTTTDEEALRFPSGQLWGWHGDNISVWLYREPPRESFTGSSAVLGLLEKGQKWEGDFMPQRYEGDYPKLDELVKSNGLSAVPRVFVDQFSPVELTLLEHWTPSFITTFNDWVKDSVALWKERVRWWWLFRTWPPF